MNVKLILFAAILILGCFLGPSSYPNDKYRRIYITIISILLILESSLRSVYVGPDTYSYYSSFRQSLSTSWRDVFSSFSDVYVEGEGKDPGFLLLMKVCQLFTSDFHVFLFLSALLFFVPFGVILYKYSTNIIQLMFAYSLYVALFQIIALSGLRQQLALGVSFIVMLELRKDNYLRAIVLLLIGSTIHVSMLIFGIMILFRMFLYRFNREIHLVSFFAIPLAIAFAGPIMSFFASFIANDYYSTYSVGVMKRDASTYVILMEVLSLFCYIALKGVNSVDNKSDLGLCYSALPLITFLVPLILLNGALIRIGQYFTLYMMVLVPLAIQSKFNTKISNLIFSVLILILLFLSLNSVKMNYYFFWQELQF